MSIKNLFNNDKKSKIISANTVQSASVEVEGVEFVKTKTKEKNKFVPPLDFSTASNFAKFGSAKLYYEYGFKRIYQQYPYDGTLAEKQAFEYSGSYLDTYIFDNLYPRTNGYVNFNILTDGKITGGSVSNGYYQSANNKEYIQILGGPHTASGGMTGLKYHDTFDESTLYDPTNKRENNLKVDLLTGNTIEFWLKKTGYDVSLGHREVLFDLTDQENKSLQLFLSASGHDHAGRNALNIRFKGVGPLAIDAPLTLDSYTTNSVGDGNWHHYAVTLKSNSTDKVTTKLFIDSVLHKEQEIAFPASVWTEIDSNTYGLLATIGAGSGHYIPTGKGDGQLFSASVDEFRFWKSERNGKQIGQNWFTPIGGGTDDSLDNINLGVYFKFNEGITLTSSTDSTILDYSGRLSNGTFVGYHADTRETGSAIVESGVVTSEFKDPIIYSYHPDVVSKQAELTTTGSLQDYENTSLFYHLMPSWIIEEDKENGNSNLEYLSQIIASYFDTLNAQISYSNRFKDKRYYGPTVNKDRLTDETSVTFSGSMKPMPFTNKLLREQGFVLPELFVDADIIQEFRKYDQNQIYERDLSEVRNLIYQNLYNNLTNIYKSKGTEKSFRNYLKCFGLNSDLIKLNLYADGATYTLKDNYELKALDTRVLNFDHENNHSANVYMNTGSGDFAYIKGNVNTDTMHSAFSIESEVIIPQKLKEDHPSYTNKSFTTSSIFGFHQIDTTSAPFNDYYGGAQLDAPNKNIKILLASTTNRDESKFVISGSDNLYLTSSIIKNAYSNSKWNLALRVNNSKYPYSQLNGTGTPTVDVSFYGIELVNGEINNYVNLTASNITDGRQYLTSSKKVFVGAEKENFSGSIINHSDIKIGDVKYWQSYITNEDLKQHALDLDNSGFLNPYRSDNIFTLDNQHVPKIDTLAFHWNFNQNTTTDTNAEMEVLDISSGSASLINRYNWLSNITKRKYHGLAHGFPASSTNVIEKTYISTAKKKSPSSVYTSDMVKIVDNEKKNFFQDDDVSDNFFSFEKSMQAVITDDILNIFASIKDFNNLIGNPINKYRPNYKEMQALRSLYFEHIENEPDQERFFEFYKWIDSSVSFGINQLLPASSRFSEGIKNTIESHVLERNKYQHKFPLVSQKTSTEGVIKSVNELKYNWKHGHSPLQTKATATIVVSNAGGVFNGDTFVLIDPSGISTTYTVNGGVAQASGGGSGGSATVGFAGVGGGVSGKIAAASAIAIAINATTDANYTAISNGVDTVTITQGVFGNTGNRTNTDSISGVTVSNFTGGNSKHNENCLWDRKRRERETTTAETIRKAINTTSKVENKILAEVDGTRYFLEDDLEKTTARVHQIELIKRNTIHGGINYRNNKNRDYYLEKTHIHGNINSEGVPENVLVVGVGEGQGLDTNVSCQSEVDSRKKYHWDFTAIVGMFSTTTGDHPLDDLYSSKSLIKGHYAFPFNFISGNISSGYNREVSSSYRGDVILTNIHSDTTYRSNDVPMQGPFTERHVGGLQSRHQPINSYNSSKNSINKIDDALLRAESFLILIGEHPDESITDGALGITGPDYGGPYPAKNQPFGIRYRNQRAKRPLNVRNIQHNTSSNIAGNYNKNYEFFSSVGRKENNFRFRSIEDQVDFVEPTLKAALPHTNVNASLVAQKTGGDGNVLSSNSNRFNDNVKSHLTPELSTVEDNKPTKSIITQKFSAPGGFETMSRVFLDAIDGERSVYNALPFRNLSVRSSGSGEFVENTSRSWLPSDDHDSTDLAIWLSQDSGLVENSGRVDTWTDRQNGVVFRMQAGNHNTYNTGTNSPSIVSAGSYNFIRFDASNHEFLAATFDNSLMNLYNSDYSIVVVYKASTSNSPPSVGDLQQQGSNIRRGPLLNIGEDLELSLMEDTLGSGFDNAIIIENETSATSYLQSITKGSEFQVVIYVYKDGGGSNYGFFADGKTSTVLEARGLSNDNPQTLVPMSLLSSDSNGSTPNMRIGRDPDYAYGNQTQQFDYAFGEFDLVEVMLFKKALETDEREKIEGYVSHKYSIESNLVSGHTYESSPPPGIVSTGINTPRVNSHNNRREGLRTLLTRPMGRFGIDSQYGTVTAETYTTEASFQKQHRNNRYSVSSSTEGYNPISDNAFVSTQIPATDLQYSWTAKLAKNEYSMTGGLHNTFRYGNKTGKVIINNQVENIINYPISSSFD